MSTQAADEKEVDKDDVFVIDDDCDEDVPGDFFDDFLKEDFMAGLDIVDDDQWENGEIKNESDSTQQPKEKSNNVKESTENAGSKRRKNRRDKNSTRNEKGKGIDADDFDIRRDPNKTKRDIERDKAKCEKDKEKKLITEKLKLVETGLVPPGMEMEVDIPDVNKDKEVKRKSESKVTSPIKKRRSRGRSGSPRRRINSPRRSPNRSARPLRIGLSPRRSPRRSPIRRRSRERISRERRSRERSIERTIRSLRRSRSGSPYRDRRSRYSSEYSRRRRRSHSRSRDKKKEEKKSFLQEIVEKLRETRPSSSMIPPDQYVQPGPHMQPIPRQMHHGPPHMQHLPPQSMQMNPNIPGAVQPVPAPTFPVVPSHPISSQMQGPSQNQYDPYDQSFFIGTPQPPGYTHPLSQHSSAISSVVNHAPGPLQKTDGSTATVSGPVGTNKKGDIPPHEVGKLFHDKKITLSEFLAITAKSEVYSGNPVQLKDKINVLSRCHDAIKILESVEKKFQGPLQLRKTVKQPLTEDKYKSPLVKTAEAKISFTEIPTKDKSKTTFTSHLNNLLQEVGLLNEAVELDDDPEPVISSFLPKGTSPPPPPHISRQRQPKRYDEPPVRIHNDNRLAKMVQTDPMPKCIDCEKRRKIPYKTSGCQTGEMMTYSVSTQVTEDEFVSRIPKNQSLASLTPAQLLAQNASSSSLKRYTDSDEFDIYPAKNFNRGSFDYSRAAESFNNSSGMMGTRYLPLDRDRIRDDSLAPNSAQYLGARGRGPPGSGYDLGSRYSYY